MNSVHMCTNMRHRFKIYDMHVVFGCILSIVGKLVIKFQCENNRHGVNHGIHAAFVYQITYLSPLKSPAHIAIPK